MIEVIILPRLMSFQLLNTTAFTELKYFKKYVIYLYVKLHINNQGFFHLNILFSCCTL